MKLADLTLFHIHPHNLDWIGFCFADFDIEPSANDDDWGFTDVPPGPRPPPWPTP